MHIWWMNNIQNKELLKLNYKQIKQKTKNLTIRKQTTKLKNGQNIWTQFTKEDRCQLSIWKDAQHYILLEN